MGFFPPDVKPAGDNTVGNPELVEGHKDPSPEDSRPAGDCGQ